MPEWRLEIQRRLAHARLRPEREAEIVDELAQHLEDRYRASVAAGRSKSDAESETWRELDAHEALGRELASVEIPVPPSMAGIEARSGGSLWSSLWQDLRYGVRALRQRPVFALTAIATVALSLGPAIAVSAVIDSLFFTPLPAIANQSRLATFRFGHVNGDAFSPWVISYANVADIAKDAATVTALTGQQSISVAVAADGAAPRRVAGQSVMANYFDVLGVRLAAGRGFRIGEDSGPGGEPVVILEETLARDLFPQGSAIGRVVHLNSLPFEIVGVTPAGFQGTLRATTAKVWIPGMAYKRVTHVPPARWAYATNRGPFYEFVVRLAPGASPAQAAAELGARTRALADRDPQTNDVFKTIAPLMMPGFGAPLSTNPGALATVRLLVAIAALLVLLGAANVANLLIFQGLAAARETAIRKALGASMRRILQLRLIQSLLLSGAGATAGAGVALVLGGLLDTFSLPGIGAMHVLISWRVATVAAALAVFVGAGFGMAPAWLAARASLTAALARGLRTGMPRAARLRHGLTVVQLALSLTLLIGALLLLVTLRHLHAVDLGLDTSDVTTMVVDLRTHGYTDARALDYHRRIIDAIRQSPGIDHVAVAGSLPLFGYSINDRVFESGSDPSRTTAVVSNAVSSDYFQVLGMPVVRGRAFGDDEAFAADGASEAPVVISETLAQRVFRSTDVVGRHLTVPKSAGIPARDLEIVGIVRDAHWRGFLQPADPVLYESLGRTTSPIASVEILVKSSIGRAQVAKQLQTAASSLDPSIPLSAETTMDEAIDRQLAQQRLFAWVFGVLAAVGFLLAAGGLYGLIAQSVSERAREFGIRLAVGANRAQVLGLVLRQAAVIAAMGSVAGLGLGWISGRAIDNQLVGVTSHDPMVYAIAVAMLVMVVFAASLAPARAATRVNPIDVLRSE